MNLRLPLLVAVVCCCLQTLAQSAPKRELRGAWIASYASIDWPNRNQSPAQQQAALLTILNHHQATGINTIYLQVRSQSDALYQSSIEPWSADLTGVQGRSPNPLWDPLQFAIDEAHKRGMELHAWINPYRAVANVNSLPGFAASHIAKRKPEWLLAAGAIRILNPGLPEVRAYVQTVIEDIVRRYDVDGIHFDDYFYPNAAFDDNATYAADPRGIADRGDWRRDNVNLLIERVGIAINALKPWVKFGVSPTGIYRNSTNPALGSPTGGLQHYVSLFADSRKWLQEGWVDYLAPQVYWYLGQRGADYGLLVPWWNNNAYGRHIYIGLAGYKVQNPSLYGADWANPSEIPDQVRYNRLPAHANIYGQSIYNTNSIRMTNNRGFDDTLRLDLYSRPALVPSMPWRDNIAPATAAGLGAFVEGDGIRLNWTAPPATSDELQAVKRYAIYRSTTPQVDTTGANLLALTPTAATTFTDRSAQPGVTYYYRLTAVDRLWNESAPTALADFRAPEISCPPTQLLTLGTGCAAPLPDYRGLASVQDDISPAAAITLTQSPAPGTLVSGTEPMSVTLTARDEAGHEASCTFTLEKADLEPPVIEDLTASITEIWPPNHKMKDVRIEYNATDACGGPVTSVLTVTSNEPQNGTGDGDTESDWEVLDNHRLKLRAERAGNGGDRIYTITVTATDAAGNVATAEVTVTVPHDQGSNAAAGSAEVAEAPVAFQVKATPNPSSGRFTLTTMSASQRPLAVRVLDNSGRTIETRANVPANGTLYLGAQYRPGVYVVELTQDGQRRTLKLVKSAR